MSKITSKLNPFPFIGRQLKRIDSLGVPIGLFYKKEQTFTTSIGGFVTLVLYTVTLMYFFYCLQPVINRQ